MREHIISALHETKTGGLLGQDMKSNGGAPVAGSVGTRGAAAGKPESTIYSHSAIQLAAISCFAWLTGR